MNKNNTRTATLKSNAARHGLFTAFALLIMLALGSGTALATGGFVEKSGGFTQQPGGFSGPGPDIVSVEQAKNMSDDSKVALRGYIVKSLGGDDYLFRDATGEIKVDIDRKKWNGQQISPEDLVEIHGEVDKDWTSVEIDVDRVIKR